MKHPVLVRPECVALAGGDLVVGVLLSQIVYWYKPSAKGKSKLGVYKNGVSWIAKTREQWMEETGLTLKQYKRAIGVLKKKGLIQVKIKRFKGVAMSHLRLIGTTQTGQKGPSEQTQKDQPLGPKGTILLTEITTESTKETTSESDLKVAGGTEHGRSEEEDEEKIRRKSKIKKEENKESKESTKMKAEDILKTMQAPTDGSLEGFWKARCALVTGAWQRALTGKERGQLAHLRKYLGDQTKPIIDYAVNHWWKFASEAGIAAGTTFPGEPNIGFLLKHHAVAVNLLILQSAKSLPPTPEETPVQPIAPAHEEQPVHTITSQELTELLEGLKSP